MQSVILRTVTRMILVIMLLVAIFILIRGHDRPGGGFIAALITASALSLYLIAYGKAVLVRLLKVDVKVWMGVGIFFLLISTLPSIALHKTWMAGIWFHVGDIKIGTPLIFDIGVFLVVVSAVMTIVLELETARE